MRRGSTWETSRAIFIASIDGFKTTANSSGRVEFGKLGFNVSKQMIWSKQSSNPSLFRTLIAWTLSEFVKICKTKIKFEAVNNYLIYSNDFLFFIFAYNLRFSFGWCYVKDYVAEDLAWSRRMAIFRERNWKLKKIIKKKSKLNSKHENYYYFFLFNRFNYKNDCSNKFFLTHGNHRHRCHSLTPATTI